MVGEGRGAAVVVAGVLGAGVLGARAVLWRCPG